MKQSFLQSSDVYNALSTSSRKFLCTSYGPLDNFIVRSLTLHWVNNPEAKKLFEFLNPFLKLPDHHTLGGEILQDAMSERDKAMQIALKEDPIGMTLTFNGWTNVKNEQLLGIVIILLEGRSYVWKAEDISSERETHVEVIEKTEAMINELKNENIKICAIVTNSASVYAAARRKLRISNKDIIFLPCFAYQLNLCIGEIFKESTDLKMTLNHAIQLATYFRNANNKFFIAKLHDQQKKTYGDQLCIKVEIFEIIDSSAFWNNLNIIVEVLYPYCKILNIIQQDKTRLFQVIYGLTYLIQFWINYEDTQLAAKLIIRLENRWNDWEQPLFLLACLLHPEYKTNQFKNNIKINYTTFGKYLFDYDKQFNGDIWRYWCFAESSTNELSLFAYRLFGICVNVASVKRLWSFIKNSCYDIINNVNKNNTNNNKKIKKNNEQILENENDDYENNDLTNLENEFGDYLQEWAEMLEEEANKNEKYKEDELDIFIETNKITHPAIDSDAKWKLKSIFNKLKFLF
ncbi:hypothetical protein RclHR1_06960007 [Rhizophagus clarus]|uniref:DUF659 domain-containing protein n=1 Tax=Rhizophagus clarus TaxID=94130 RepID=A0A2Z6SK71_9GLOM|nr:hypothetical protein RclHR1_06960007 [Rhizophagus clarus]